MRAASLSAVLFVAMAATPVVASPCSEQISALSGQVHEQGREAIAANTSGQADAAARGGQGQTGVAGEAATRPPEKSAEAGKGADTAQAAKVALDEARTADGKGDETGCTEAVARAKKALAGAP